MRILSLPKSGDCWNPLYQLVFSGAGDLFNGKVSRCHLRAPGEATSRPGCVRLAKLHLPMIGLFLCRVKDGMGVGEHVGHSAGARFGVLLRKGRRQSAHGERTCSWGTGLDSGVWLNEFWNASALPPTPYPSFPSL